MGNNFYAFNILEAHNMKINTLYTFTYLSLAYVDTYIQTLIFTNFHTCTTHCPMIAIKCLRNNKNKIKLKTSQTLTALN